MRHDSSKPSLAVVAIVAVFVLAGASAPCEEKHAVDLNMKCNNSSAEALAKSMLEFEETTELVLESFAELPPGLKYFAEQLYTGDALASILEMIEKEYAREDAAEKGPERVFSIESQEKAGDGSVTAVILSVTTNPDGEKTEARSRYTLKQEGSEWKVSIHERKTGESEWAEQDDTEVPEDMGFKAGDQPEVKPDFDSPKAAVETYSRMSRDIFRNKLTAFRDFMDQGVEFLLKALCKEKADTLKTRYDECVERAMPFKTWAIGDVEEDGDKAKVTVTISTAGSPDGDEETIELLKVDGKWKVTLETCASQLMAIF